jgi:hypothetical protein
LSYTFSIDCGQEKIIEVDYFGIPPDYDSYINNEINCYNYKTSINLTLDNSCSYGEKLNNITLTNCQDRNSCEIELPSLLELKTKCINLISKSYPFYLAYTCYCNILINTAPKVNILNFQVERSYFAIYVVCTDCASIIILLIGLATINLSQKTNERYFKKNVTKISDYTVHFVKRGLKNAYIYWELGCLVEHLNNVLQIETGEKDVCFIYDINYPIFNSRLMSLYNNKTLYNSIIKDLSQGNENMEEDAKTRIETRILGYRKKIQKVNNDIETERVKGLNRIDDVFITFTDIKYSLIMKRAYRRSAFKRCCIIFCCMENKIKHL